MDIKEHWFMILIVALLFLWAFVHESGATTNVSLFIVTHKSLISVPYVGDIEPVIARLPSNSVIRVSTNIVGNYLSVSEPNRKIWSEKHGPFYWVQTNKTLTWNWIGVPTRIPQPPSFRSIQGVE